MSKSNHTSFFVLLLLFLMGGGLGYMANRFIDPSSTASCNVDSLLTANRTQLAEIETLRQEVDDLNETIDELFRQIDSKNETIYELNKFLVYGTSNEYEQKAQQYLLSNNEWYILGMKKACNNDGKYHDTEAYKFLSYLLEADKLDANRLNFILSFKVEGNAKWDEIVSAMKAKKSAGTSVSRFADALKEANTVYDARRMQLRSGTGFLDGTIRLNDLFRNINAIIN